MRRLAFVVSIFVSFLVSSSPLFADGMRHGGKMGCGENMMACHDRMMHGMMKKMLSKEQMGKVNTIHEKYAEQMKQKNEEMGKIFMSMGDEMMKASPDKAVMEGKHKEMSNVMAQMGDLKFQMHFEMATTVFTPEQRKKMVEEMKKHHGKMMKHMEKKGMGHGMMEQKETGTAPTH